MLSSTGDPRPPRPLNTESPMTTNHSPRNAAWPQNEILRAFAAHLRAVEGKARQTAADYAKDGRYFLEFLGREYPDLTLNDIDPSHIVAYLVDQEDRGRAATTRRRSVFALRSFLAFAADSPTSKQAAHGVKPPKATSPKTDVYTDTEIERILAHGEAQTSLRGRLARAIVVTVWSTGLRRSELTELKRASVDMDARRLTVVGKGDKQRRVPIPRPLVETLTEYLAEIRPQLPGDDYLFANPNSQIGGAHYGRMSKWTLSDLVSKHCKNAGVTSKINLHKWRHTYATTVLRKSGDLQAVQRLLGHSAIQTTLRYVHMVDDDLFTAVDKAFE